jgi:hypothetical protein
METLPNDDPELGDQPTIRLTHMQAGTDTGGTSRQCAQIIGDARNDLAAAACRCLQSDVRHLDGDLSIPAAATC